MIQAVRQFPTAQRNQGIIRSQRYAGGETRFGYQSYAERPEMLGNLSQG